MSLHLASAAENRQTTVAEDEFLRNCQAATCRFISSKDIICWARHCLDRVPISISAIFSQEAWTCRSPQNLKPYSDSAGFGFRDAPFFLPGLKFVFFSVFITAVSDMLSTTPICKTYFHLHPLNVEFKEALNKSSFCGKRLEYMGFFRKNNLKSEVP